MVLSRAFTGGNPSSFVKEVVGNLSMRYLWFDSTESSLGMAVMASTNCRVQGRVGPGGRLPRNSPESFF